MFNSNHNIKFFRSVMVVLLAFSLLLAGCSVWKTSALSEDFQKVLGAELSETIEPTAEAMVQELTDAYETYAEDSDLMAFTLSVDGIMDKYDSFIDQVRDEISAKMEKETDPELKWTASALLLQGTSFHNIALRLAIFDYERLGFYTGDEAELEQSIFEAINGVSQWFFAKDIVPVS